MKIKNAIIIHGPGRSGTTLLSNIMALHPDLGWVSSYVNKYPKKTYLSLVNNIQSISAIEQWNRKKKNFPRPTEAYNFWLHYVPQFNNEDIEVIDAKNGLLAVGAIEKVLKATGKNRFMTKITGMSRYQFIEAVFDNPTIVWIDRNPLSIITSYHKKKWGYKNKPALFKSKPTEDLLQEYTQKYMTFRDDKKNLDRFNTIYVEYEDLVEDRYSFFKKICDATNLKYEGAFEDIVKSWDIAKGTNEAYKKYFSSEEQQYVLKMLGEQ